MENLKNQSPEITILDFKGAKFRSIMDENGKRWFVAKDVLKYLGVSNHIQFINRLVKNEKRLASIVDRMGRPQQINVVNESGLYSLVFAKHPIKSRGVSNECITDCQNKLKDFRLWVMQMMSAGNYKTEENGTPHVEETETMGTQIAPVVTDNSLSKRISFNTLALEHHKAILQIQINQLQLQANQLQLQANQLQLQANQLSLQTPIVERYNKVHSDVNLHTANSIAAQLGITVQALNKFLVDHGYIYKQGKIYLPNSKIRGKGYCDFEIKKYTLKSGETKIREYLKWTDAGRQFVIDKYNQSNTRIGE